MWSSVHSQLGRHLQFESALASVALVGHAVAGLGIGLFPEAHTYALGGARGTALGLATSLLTIGGLAVVWLRSTRAAQSAEGIVLFYAAAIAIVVAFGHVLSPQYLIWLIPLVPLVGGDLGRLVTALLVGACILTNIWFPKYFVRAIQTLDSGSILLLAVRNALLVAIALLLALAVWRLPRHAPPDGASQEPASEHR
jgi:hypothetical protein